MQNFSIKSHLDTGAGQGDISKSLRMTQFESVWSSPVETYQGKLPRNIKIEEK